MITQTPIQIATESIKGCGKSKSGFRASCGTTINGYCPSCKSKIQTHKQDWEGELGRLKKLRLGLNYRVCEYCDSSVKDIESDISELTQALKILEGGK